MRAFGGLIAGLVAGFLVMMLAGFVGGLMFPMGAQMDPYDAQQIQSTFASASLGAKFMVVLSWALGALAGAVVAKKLTGADWTAWTIAVIFALYVLASVFVLPMPGWLQAIAVALPLVSGYIATRHVRGRPAATSDTHGAL
jgi:hypothetical protein